MSENLDQDTVNSTNTDEEESSTDSVESTEETDVDQEESVDERDKRIAEMEKTIKQLTARAKKAESKDKRTDLKTPDVPSSEEVDERILRSQGMGEDLIKELKRVAKFNETDLFTAQSDPMFTAIKEKKEQEARDKQAALGASKGSGNVASKKDLTTPGLSTEEHRELFNKALNR